MRVVAQGDGGRVASQAHEFEAAALASTAQRARALSGERKASWKKRETKKRPGWSRRGRQKLRVDGERRRKKNIKTKL